MATITKFVDGRYPVVNVASNLFKSENFIDFSTRNAAIGDVVQAIKVPANCHVSRVYWYVVSGQASVANVTIGDGADADGFESAADMTTTGNNGSTVVADGYGYGKFYTAADTIDITIAGANATTLKLYIACEGFICDQALA